MVGTKKWSTLPQTNSEFTLENRPLLFVDFIQQAAFFNCLDVPGS